MNLMLGNKKYQKTYGNEWNALVMFSSAPQGFKKFKRKLQRLRIEVHICKSLGALLFKKRHWPLLVNFMLHFSK